MARLFAILPIVAAIAQAQFSPKKAACDLLSPAALSELLQPNASNPHRTDRRCTFEGANPPFTLDVRLDSRRKMEREISGVRTGGASVSSEPELGRGAVSATMGDSLTIFAFRGSDGISLTITGLTPDRSPAERLAALRELAKIAISRLPMPGALYSTDFLNR